MGAFRFYIQSKNERHTQKMTEREQCEMVLGLGRARECERNGTEGYIKNKWVSMNRERKEIFHSFNVIKYLCSGINRAKACSGF